MGRPKKLGFDETDVSHMTLRTDARELSVAAAIAALRNETLSDVLREAIKNYIKEHKKLLTAAAEEMSDDQR